MANSQKKETIKEQNNSTKSSEIEAERTEKQVKQQEAATPVGIDYTDPEQRKKDWEEARKDNEQNRDMPEGTSFKK